MVVEVVDGADVFVRLSATVTGAFASFSSRVPLPVQAESRITAMSRGINNNFFKNNTLLYYIL